METKTKMTQGEEIILYLTEKGSITSIQAACELHITQLAARICELKRKGYKITSTSHRGTNKYGRVTRYDIYKLEEK